jgi:hypothetical protein
MPPGAAARFATVVFCLLVGARSAAADLLPVPPLPPERSLWVNLEILPGDGTTALPKSLRDIESGRLQAEEATIEGKVYRKTSIILPLANGDRRELILLLAEEDGHVRMLGFHRVLRHRDAPEGQTTVFQSGSPNPLSGDAVQVPADTYSYLALCTALSSFAAKMPPIPLHVWFQNSPLPVDLVFDGQEKLDVLGAATQSLRLRIKPHGGKGPEAVYWFGDQPPHVLLQYRGPGDFLTAAGESAPNVVLRATASSEQVRSIFRN